MSEFERCLSLLNILPHPSVLNILNKNLDTEDIISLTQVCKWTYNIWSFMIKFAVEFQMGERLTKKYGWKFKNAKNVIKQYRKKMTKRLIPEKDPHKPVWCVGGCGKRVLCPRRIDKRGLVNILTHNLCTNCSKLYFTKSRNWVYSFSLQSTVKERLGHTWTEYHMFHRLSDYDNEERDFRNKNRVSLIFNGISVYPKKDVEQFIEHWFGIYKSSKSLRFNITKSFDGYSW